MGLRTGPCIVAAVMRVGPYWSLGAGTVPEQQPRSHRRARGHRSQQLRWGLPDHATHPQSRSGAQDHAIEPGHICLRAGGRVRSGQIEDGVGVAASIDRHDPDGMSLAPQAVDLL